MQPSAFVRRLTLPAFAAGVLLASGCGTPAEGPADAGPTTADAGTFHEPLTVCDDPAMAEAQFSANKANVSFDTSAATLAPRDLGLGCNNDDANEWAPQVVVKATIPGTGPKALLLTTRNTATSKKLPLFLQVREECGKMPAGGFPPACLGPDNTDVRGAGRVTVEGGKTYFIVISGYSEAPTGYSDRGAGRLDLQVADAALPTLDQASASAYGPFLVVKATAGDQNKNLAGLAMQLLTADDKLVDLDGNGVGDERDVIAAGFSPAPGAVTSYTGSITLTGTQQLLAQSHAAKIRLRAFDTDLGLSEAKTVALSAGQLSKVGEACDADRLCSEGIECTQGVCTASAGATKTCEDYQHVQLAVPQNGEATTATVTGSIASGTGWFEASCGPTGGLEGGFSVDVPEGGKYDLVARTDLADVPKKSYTIVYIRSVCADAATELACSAGIANDDSRSVAVAYDVAPGRYYAFVEPNDQLPFSSYPFKMQLALRPVLDTGAACDTSEVKNRCAKAHCLFATKTCP